MDIGERSMAMTEADGSLFGGKLPRQTKGELLVVPQAGQTLTKAQGAFNRLVIKIEKLHAKLNAETQKLDAALAYLREHLHPKRERVLAGRKKLLLALAPFLDSDQLKKKERTALKGLMGGQLEQISREDHRLIEGELRVVFQQVYGVSYEQAAAEDMEEARENIKEMFDNMGLDVDLSGFRADMTDEEMIAESVKMGEKLKAQEEAAQKQESGKRERKKTKRELAKEAKEQAAEEVRKRSIGVIYKQLARVLHPDLEPDAALKERKGRLMQELTAAYRDNDLHAMLRLELEWIRGEQSDVQRLGEERLSVYNQVLREQASDLEHQLHDLPGQPHYQPLMVPMGPFNVGLVDGPSESRRLDSVAKSLDAMLAQLRTGQAVREVREMLREYQR